MTFFHHIGLFIDSGDEKKRAEFLELGLELPEGKKVPRGELVTLEISEEDPRWEKIREKVSSLERQGRATDLKLNWPWEQEVRRLKQLASRLGKSQLSELGWLEGYSGQTTEQLVALEGKYQTDSVVLAFEQAISQRADRDGMQSLTDDERIVLAVEALEREVNNGGYDQFFTNSSREFASIIVDSLKRIGCKKAANITQRAIKALGTSSLTETAIEAALGTDDEIREKKLGRCDDAYYANAEPIAERLFAFIKANRTGFRF